MYVQALAATIKEIPSQERTEGFIVEANSKWQAARLVASGKQLLTATAAYAKNINSENGFPEWRLYQTERALMF